MCENENLFVFGGMDLFCSHCAKSYKIEANKSKTPFEERTFYLVPIDKSIHSEDRERVLKECIVIPTPNFEDSKEDEVLEYKRICAKFSKLKREE
jgi:hypothetical protein